MVLNKNSYIILALILLALPLISAKQITQTSTSELQIAHPQYDYIPQNMGFELRIHVVNSTKSKTNITTSCFLDLYNPDGTATTHYFLKYDYTDTDFAVVLSANNFSKLGTHSFYIQCNSSNEIGFVNGVFEITPLGIIPDDYKIKIYMLWNIGMIFIILLSLIGSIAIPWGTKKNPEGVVLGVHEYGYLKIMCMFFSYTFLMFYFGGLKGIMASYLSYNIGGAFFNYAYQFMFALIWPIMVVSLFAVVMNYINGKKIQDAVNRGVEVRW